VPTCFIDLPIADIPCFGIIDAEWADWRTQPRSPGKAARRRLGVPSIQAIDEKVKELYRLLKAAGTNRPVKRFYSRQGQEISVVEQIARHLEATRREAGSIIFITHRAFTMMPHWYHADRWHGIIDEIPGISYSFSEGLPDNRQLLLDYPGAKRAAMLAATHAIPPPALRAPFHPYRVAPQSTLCSRISKTCNDRTHHSNANPRRHC
jgi:hypothetical protein